jgi:HEAT repeat protein
MLVELGAGADVGLAIDALSRLAGSDPDAARAALARRTDAGPAFDGVRAALGDAAAAARLTASFAAATSRERLLALRSGEGLADLPVTAIAPLLSDPAPPVRAAAIETLARIQGAAASERLRPLLGDADPYVQATAAVALGRLGDPAGLERLNVMVGSSVADTAAMAAAVLKDRGVDVSAAAERILADPNPLTRLSAIPLLHDPVRAQVLMSEAATDGNPVVRARAGQLLTQEARDIPTIRRLLRDPNPDVRLGAAAALLRFVRSGR